MAVDKLVDSSQLNSDLVSVANAIRAKSGGSSPLSFPAEFVSEIGNIPSGGTIQEQTGTVTGDDTGYAKIPCAFMPDFLYIVRSDSTVLDTRVFAGGIFFNYKTYLGKVFYQQNANTLTISVYSGDLTSSGMSYSGGIITINVQTTRPFSSSCQYQYCAIKCT